MIPSLQHIRWSRDIFKLHTTLLWKSSRIILTPVLPSLAEIRPGPFSKTHRAPTEALLALLPALQRTCCRLHSTACRRALCFVVSPRSLVAAAERTRQQGRGCLVRGSHRCWAGERNVFAHHARIF